MVSDPNDPTETVIRYTLSAEEERAADIERRSKGNWENRSERTEPGARSRGRITLDLNSTLRIVRKSDNAEISKQAVLKCAPSAVGAIERCG